MRVNLIHCRQKQVSFSGDWLYLGENYLDMRAWEQLLPPDAHRISWARQLPAVAKKLRKPFIEWISELGEHAHDSHGWWMTWLASRNNMVTPIFTHLCYLELLEELLQRESSPLTVVCEDWFLLRTVERRLQTLGYPVARAPGWRQRLFKDIVKAIKTIRIHWITTIIQRFDAHRAARLTRQNILLDKKIIKKRALMFSCIDEASFGSNNTFHDRYFGTLSQWLTDKDYHVTILVNPYNIKRSLLAAYTWFRCNSRDFLIPEDYIRLWDYGFAVGTLWQSWRALAGRHVFQGREITPLLTRERFRALRSAGLIRFLLNEYALRRWLKEGHRCDLYLDTFENNPTERSQIRALRRYAQNCRIIGYYHTLVTRDYLAYHTTAREWKSGALPDIVVTNGALARKILLEQGIPLARVREGPALRHAYLVTLPSRSVSKRTCVLALLSIVPNYSAELLHNLLVLNEFLLKKRIPVRLKPHPMIYRESLLTECGIYRLPDNWSWAEGNVHDHLLDTIIALGNTTGSLIDAAAAGCIAIPVAKEMSLMSNYLDVFDSFGDRLVYPDVLITQFMQALERISDGSNLEINTLTKQVRSSLNPVEARYLSAFLQ